MYQVPAEENLLSQGDIFRGTFLFPYVHDPAEEPLLAREDTTRRESQVEDAWATGSEVLLLPAYKTDHAIILSNTCDIAAEEREPLEFVAMGGILPIDRIPTESRGNCRRNRFIRYHFLAAHPDTNFEESYVHFGLLTLVRHESLSNLTQSRILTLRSPHRESLGHRFGEFFSRVAIPPVQA